jgi:hypothetical protein
MDMNELRRLLASGELAPEDMQAAGVPNELAKMLLPMATAPNVPPMAMNTMRVESGPDAGKVTDLNFTAPASTGCNASRRHAATGSPAPHHASGGHGQRHDDQPAT